MEATPWTYLFTLATVPLPQINTMGRLHLFPLAHRHSSQIPHKLPPPDMHSKIISPVIPRQIKHTLSNTTIRTENEHATMPAPLRFQEGALGERALVALMDHTGQQAQEKEVNNLP